MLPPLLPPLPSRLSHYTHAISLPPLATCTKSCHCSPAAAAFYSQLSATDVPSRHPCLPSLLFLSSAIEITLSYITPLLPSSSFASHIVMVVDATSCSHVAVDRHCPFPSLSRCFSR
ncbi:hypothetical protein GW17_00016763 [Ensete ventricosum]|nr:hypothetical protein GW17_00016763 [Ensete ventricosum]